MTIYVTFYVNTLPLSTLPSLYFSLPSTPMYHMYIRQISKAGLAISVTYVVHLNKGPAK